MEHAIKYLLNGKVVDENTAAMFFFALPDAVADVMSSNIWAAVEESYACCQHVANISNGQLVVQSPVAQFNEFAYQKYKRSNRKLNAMHVSCEHGSFVLHDWSTKTTEYYRQMSDLDFRLTSLSKW